MDINYELYKVFYYVATSLSFSEASKQLFISQSAVSQSIKQLETALQARLFARSPRGVSLTWEGQMLYQYVRSALGLLATGEDKLSQAQQLLLGTLTIGASDTVTSQFLLPYLDRFHRQYPAIHIQIISGRSHKVLGLLQSGKVLFGVEIPRGFERAVRRGDKPALLLNMAEDSDTGRLFVTDNSKAKTTLVLDIHSGNSPFCSLMRGQECMQGL